MTAVSSLKEDIHRDPQELEREADQARDAIEDTLFELEQRLSPSQLVDRVMNVVKENGGEFSANLMAQVRNNPVPTMLTMLGMAWLMMASKRPPPRYGYVERGGLSRRFGSAMSSVRNAAASTRHTASDAIGAVRHAADSTTEAASRMFDSGSSSADHLYESTTSAASRAYESTAHAASRAADTTRHTADSVLRATRARARSVSETYSQLAHEQPLVLGAIAVIAGAALGALLPSSRAENEWLGETSDEARARLKSRARQRLDDLEDAGEQAVDAARRAVTNGAQEAERAARPPNA